MVLGYFGLVAINLAHIQRKFIVLKCDEWKVKFLSSAI